MLVVIVQNTSVDSVQQLLFRKVYYRVGKLVMSEENILSNLKLKRKTWTETHKGIFTEQ